MVSCTSLLKSVMVAIVLVILTDSGSAAEKLASCCTKVTTEEITDPILGYLVQNKPTPPCVRAVIFQTEKGLFCTYARAPWVREKIRAFEKEKLENASLSTVSPSDVSLLSIITSTASPSSSAAHLSPSSSAAHLSPSSSAAHLSPSSSAAHLSPSSLPFSSSTSKAAVGETISEDKE